MAKDILFFWFKLCPKCGQWKPCDIKHFYPHSKASSGFNSYCRQCIRKQHPKDRRANLYIFSKATNWSVHNVGTDQTLHRKG